MAIKKMLRISVKRPIGFRSSEIGAGGREFNIKEDKIFKEFRITKKRKI